MKQVNYRRKEASKLASSQGFSFGINISGLPTTVPSAAKGEGAMKKNACNGRGVPITDAQTFQPKLAVWKIYLPASNAITHPRFHIQPPPPPMGCTKLFCFFCHRETNLQICINIAGVVLCYNEVEPLLKKKKLQWVAWMLDNCYQCQPFCIPQCHYFSHTLSRLVHSAAPLYLVGSVG